MVIYKTTCLVNNKIYIGQHQCGKNCKNKCSYLGSGSYFSSAIKKYGKKNFIKEILEENIKTFKALDKREKYWIKKFDANNPDIGYNLTPGGFKWQYAK